MRAARALAWCCVAALGFGARSAGATGFTDVGQDILPREESHVEVHGYLRTRGEALYNLDLDRGLTPSGKPLFPVSAADPRAQTLTYWDMRLRTDVAVYTPGATVAVKARFDLLDNFPLGGSADGIPSASTTQRPPGQALSLKRAYGEALTPIGLLAAGRMGSNWGLGMLTNGGDCADCDSGDAADRLAFLMPALGHIFAVAYDFSATGPFGTRPSSTRLIALEPSTSVRSVTLAALNFRDDEARIRRRKAGKATFEYGAYFATRWQKNDLPTAYLPSVSPMPITSAQIMSRNAESIAIDGWARLTLPWLRVEAEAAYLAGKIEQASLLPGVLLNQPITSNQFGAAIESEIGRPESKIGGGLDMGYASGDSAPGFGVNTQPGAPTAKPGDIDGAQVKPPYDNHVDNFRFHPDYRVDRILFREIIGTVTNATYLRPHVRWRIADIGRGSLSAGVAAVASWAQYATSTPGGKRPLGIEIDPTLAYAHSGFYAALEHGILFPLSGLDNPVAHLDAKPAQLIRLRLAFAF